MKDIKSMNTFEVTGRGIIKSVQLDQGSFVVGEELKIDNESFIISAIEMTKGLFGYGKNVGLVVRPS